MRAGPGRFGDPASRPLRVVGRGGDEILLPPAQHRAVHGAVVRPLQPVVPPADRVLQKAVGRSGRGEMRVFVRPRSDQAAPWTGQARQHARDRVAVGVGPATDQVDGRADRRKILADRAVRPVGVARLVAQPGAQQQRLRLQPLDPHVAPAVADHGGIGRPRLVAEHRGGPAQIVGQQPAAHIVDVVGVAVVGAAQRDHRAQRRRSPRRHLQSVEAAPRNADHADGAAAPGLRHQPVDHLKRIVLFQRKIFVEQQAVGIAGAAHVDTHAGIAVAGHVRVGQRVAHRRAVGQPVRQIFQDGRHRRRIDRTPTPREQPRAVGQRNEAVIGDDRAGKAFDMPHMRRIP